MTAETRRQILSRPLQPVRVIKRKEVLAQRVPCHATQSAPQRCACQAYPRTESESSSVAKDAYTLEDVTELDEAVRRWLRGLLEEHSKSEIARWMTVDTATERKKPSRTQLDGFLAAKDNEPRNFTVAYIARIASGLGITPGEAWMQIYDEIPKERRRSPLPGRADREAELASEPPERQPAIQSSKKAR